MEWKEINVLIERHCIEAVAGVFHHLGSGGVVIEDPRTAPPAVKPKDKGSDPVAVACSEGDLVAVKAYFSEDGPTLEEIRSSLQRVNDNFAVQCRIMVNEVREEDWAETWKQHFHTFKVGERLVIKPSWEIHQPQAGEVIIEIDPGMAFGTGIHASTRFCLLFLDEFMQDGMSVIDAGCGSGILSIAAALLGADRVFSMDIDPLAVKIAVENVQLNKMEHIVQVGQGDISAELPDWQADIMVANIIAEVVVSLIPGAAKNLPTGGWFFGSGIIESQWLLVQEQLQKYGFTIEKVLKEAEWIGVAARKR
ncbi:MAG TPA: 50S ribosomal protein L11 methyltransferase [Syntrophomonadaceae bacterium]|nr:50S ribosomal protein L11 methyltransferase [Syntrophomonadaceae bacterium]